MTWTTSSASISEAQDLSEAMELDKWIRTDRLKTISVMLGLIEAFSDVQALASEINVSAPSLG